MMNKRGVLIFEIGLWLMRILMVIVILGGVALQIRTYINARVNMDVVEPALLIQALGSSPAFLYRDVAGTYQRAISLERFKQAEPELNVVFDYGKQRHAAAKLTLTDDKNNELASIYLNPQYFAELASQAPGLFGGTVTGIDRRWPVMLIDKGKERTGILSIQVLQPT